MKPVAIEIDVLSLIVGYSFGGLTGLGIAACIMLAWTFFSAWTEFREKNQ